KKPAEKPAPTRVFAVAEPAEEPVLAVEEPSVAVLGATDPNATSGSPVAVEPSFIDFLITNPHKILSVFYAVMGGAVLIGLSLLLFFEIRHHHVRAAIVSSFFLLLLILLFVVYRYSIFSGFAIG